MFSSCCFKSQIESIYKRSSKMKWSTPAFTDLRFGFEITMYIANR
jgi:coenzyme PQQ precursor peptide PqqA